MIKFGKKMIKFEDMDTMGKFLFIASMKVAINFSDIGYDKKKYIEWCSEIWDSMKMNNREDLENALNGAMEKDIDKFIKKS